MDKAAADAPPKHYRRQQGLSDSLFFPRSSSEARILGGTALSSIVHAAWAAANFGYMVAHIHDFRRADKALHVLKYGAGALGLAFAYFSMRHSAINEVLFGIMKRRYGQENFYLNHSTAALACMPLFSALACELHAGGVAKVSFAESRQLAYRYVGTLCCLSLVAETVLQWSRYRLLTASAKLPESKSPWSQFRVRLFVRPPTGPESAAS